jgi:hypothetical protein
MDLKVWTKQFFITRCFCSYFSLYNNNFLQRMYVFLESKYYFNSWSSVLLNLYCDFLIKINMQKILGRISCLHSIDMTRVGYRKQRFEQFFVAAGTSLSSSYLSLIEENTGSPTGTSVLKFFCCCAYSLPREGVYRAVAYQRKEENTLPILCLATTGGIHVQTHRMMEGI